MRGEGADGPVVAKKPGNAGGARGPDSPVLGTGQPARGGAGVEGKALVEAGGYEPDEARVSRPVLP